jgi:hypothetical protein
MYRGRKVSGGVIMRKDDGNLNKYGGVEDGLAIRQENG